MASAHEYAGGPLSCWLEFEEGHQKTVPDRHPAKGKGYWLCKGEKGRIVFSVGRVKSARMRALLAPDGDDEPDWIRLKLIYRDSTGQTGAYHADYAAALWYTWPNFQAAADLPLTRTVKDGDDFSLVRHKTGEEGGDLRGVSMNLKGAFGTPKE